MTRRTFVRRKKTAEEALPTPPEPTEPEPAPAPEPVPAKAPPREPAFDADALEELARMDSDAFAAAMAGLPGQGGRRGPQNGDEVEGVVVGFTDKSIFVDIGGKAEATLDREELPEAQVGDTVHARVLASGERGVRLGIKLRGADAREHLETAREAGVPVEGRVVERNKGGFVVELAGVRAFCPVSRIDPRPGEDLDVWVGRTLTFRIVEIKARDVVVDRRKLVEEEEALAAEKAWGRLAAGQKKTGRVDSVHDFGAFVTVDGVRGLVPRSALGETELKSGEEIEVRVERVDRQRERLSLSLGRAPARGLPQDTGSLGTFADLFAKAKK